MQNNPKEYLRIIKNRIESERIPQNATETERLINNYKAFVANFGKKIVITLIDPKYARNYL